LRYNSGGQTHAYQGKEGDKSKPHAFPSKLWLKTEKRKEKESAGVQKKGHQINRQKTFRKSHETEGNEKKNAVWDSSCIPAGKKEKPPLAQRRNAKNY